MKPIIYEAKGLIKLPGRGLMTFAEYRKEFGRSPVTGEKLGVPLIAAHFGPLLSGKAISALEAQRRTNLIRSGEKFTLPKKMLRKRGKPRKGSRSFMSLPVMEKLAGDYLIPGLIEQKKQEIEFFEKMLGWMKKNMAKKETRGKKKA